ncbi:MAG: TRAP transporter large permease [Deltaproteobacteria bacterium]|nr:TRAP transporter large permease [Deltaproteobacteria bacterium]
MKVPFESFVLIGGFLILMVFRVPIAFSMGIASLAYLLYTGMPVTVLSQRLSAGLNSFPLLAIPLYILVGQLMNTSGMSQRIFDFSSTLVGHIRGGLGHVNILASMIFAGVSGTAVSDAASLGAIEMKVMKEEGYDPVFSAAVTAASSTIGPIIPPSVVLIIYGVMAEVSIGRLFMGGLLPGVAMGFLMMVLVYHMAKKITMPVRPRASLSEGVRSFRNAFFPLLLPFIILSGIAFGITTPTEAGAIAVAYSFLLGILYKEITTKNISSIFSETVTVTCSVMFVVANATLFSWLLVSQNIPQRAADFILSFTGDPLLVFFLINLFILILGMFLDTMAILIIATPVLVPMVSKLGIDLVHFGVVMTLNLMIGGLTPPMGILCYIVSDVGRVPVEKVFRAILIFLIPLLICLFLITFIPPLVTFLPDLLFK